MMKTDDLIRSLAADHMPAKAMPAAWRWAVLLAIVLGAAAFFSLMKPRHDFAEALGSYRFLFKFVVTIALAATALRLVSILSRPGDRPGERWLLAALAPLLLLIGAGAEMMVFPETEWMGRMIGRNSIFCLAAIPVIGLAPLAVLLLALRHGAPTSPGLAGAFGGLAAGGISATFYALHCPDDSPLFVAAWYTIAVLMLMLLGAFFGRAFARW